MCGISGFIHLANGGDVSRSRLLAMLKSLHHRGPDDGGVWIDKQHGVALGHRRLSILDLSPAGHHPMGSACGRFVVSVSATHLDCPAILVSSNT